jgi:hypothetical protein
MTSFRGTLVPLSLSSGSPLMDTSWGPVVAAAAFVPCRPASGGLPISVVSGEVILGAPVLLSDVCGASHVSLSEAVMLTKVMRYSPLGKPPFLLVVP